MRKVSALAPPVAPRWRRQHTFAATPADHYPRTAGAATTLARYISTEQYLWGLHRVLDGIATNTDRGTGGFGVGTTGRRPRRARSGRARTLIALLHSASSCYITTLYRSRPASRSGSCVILPRGQLATEPSGCDDEGGRYLREGAFNEVGYLHLHRTDVVAVVVEERHGDSACAGVKLEMDVANPWRRTCTSKCRSSSIDVTVWGV
jgi:hypothetical protein